MAWSLLEKDVVKVDIKIEGRNVEHIRKRKEERRISLEQIDIALKRGIILEGNRERFKIIYNDGGECFGVIGVGNIYEIYNKYGFTKSEQLSAPKVYGLMISLCTVINCRYAKIFGNFERKVNYFFDTNILRDVSERDGYKNV